MEVKFLCTSCKSRLGADARWEGRAVICSVCGDRTRVPHWSGFAHRRRTAETPPAANASLSPEEIAFLSLPATAQPTAGA